MQSWLPKAVRAMGLAATIIVLSAGAGRAATKTVQVGPNGALVFSPSTVTVNVGDTVEWVWGSGVHSTTRDTGPETWDSGVSGPPQMFSHTFHRAGMFPYFCSVHQQLGMVGTVVVRQPVMSTTTTSMAQGTSTTSTTIAGELPPPCVGIEACRQALIAALPTPAMATSGKARRVARHLDRLDHHLEKLLDRAATATGERQVHDFAKAGRILERLRTAADKAETNGTLAVAVGPIDAADQSLMTLLPTQ
jgi:plastocyanin